jgi:hypothetical protein
VVIGRIDFSGTRRAVLEAMLAMLDQIRRLRGKHQWRRMGRT